MSEQGSAGPEESDEFERRGSPVEATILLVDALDHDNTPPEEIRRIEKEELIQSSWGSKSSSGGQTDGFRGIEEAHHDIWTMDPGSEAVHEYLDSIRPRTRAPLARVLGSMDDVAIQISKVGNLPFAFLVIRACVAKDISRERNPQFLLKDIEELLDAVAGQMGGHGASTISSRGVGRIRFLSVQADSEDIKAIGAGLQDLHDEFTREPHLHHLPSDELQDLLPLDLGRQEDAHRTAYIHSPVPIAIAGSQESRAHSFHNPQVIHVPMTRAELEEEEDKNRRVSPLIPGFPGNLSPLQGRPETWIGPLGSQAWFEGLSKRIDSLHRNLTETRDQLSSEDELSQVQESLDEILDIRSEVASLGLDLHAVEGTYRSRAQKALDTPNRERVSVLRIPFAPTAEQHGLPQPDTHYVQGFHRDFIDRTDLVRARLDNLHEMTTNLASSLESRFSVKVDRSIQRNTRLMAFLTIVIAVATVVNLSL